MIEDFGFGVLLGIGLLPILVIWKIKLKLNGLPRTKTVKRKEMLNIGVAWVYLFGPVTVFGLWLAQQPIDRIAFILIVASIAFLCILYPSSRLVRKLLDKPEPGS